jgi:hypothetical protein
MPSGRPIYPTSEVTQMGLLTNRVDSLERRKAVAGFYEIKVFADDEELETGDGAFIFAIPLDLDESTLRYANAFITTVSSSGLVTVQFRNVTQGVDMLSTRITIDVGETNGETAATPAVIKTSDIVIPYPLTDASVFERDLIAIDVDTAGTGAKGLGVMLGFDA